MSLDRKGSFDSKSVARTFNNPLKPRGLEFSRKNLKPKEEKDTVLAENPLESKDIEEPVRQSNPSRFDAAREKVFGILVRSKLGRALVATGIGLTSLPMVLATSVDAELDPNSSCIRVGYAPDSILNDGVSSTALEVVVEPGCKDAIVGITAVASNPQFKVGGVNPKDREGRIRIPVQDTGLGADKAAGDLVFTSESIVYDSTEGIPLTQYKDVQRLYTGSPLSSNSLNILFKNGEQRNYRIPELFLLDKNVPLDDIKQTVSLSLQATDHVINLRDDSGIVGKKIREQDFDLTKVATLTGNLYANFGEDNDHYDILTLSSAKKTYKKENINDINGSAGFAIITRQEATGTAAPDSPASYKGIDKDTLLGSRGKLKLLAFVNEPINPDATFHEWFHLAGAHFDPSLGLNNIDSHWKNNVSQGGILYGNRMVDNGDGTMTTLGRQHTASKLEQYLMGWIWPNQLPDIKVALDENQRFNTPGTVIHGPFRTVTAQDIINTYGYRIPDPSTSLRNLKVGYVFTTDNRMATPVEMTVKEKIIQTIPQLWNKATEGNSTVEFVTPFTNSKDTQKNIVKPEEGATLASYEIPLQSNLKPDAKWAHVQLVPAGGDGPGIDNLYGDPKVLEDIKKGAYKIPAPDLEKGSFIALPDMGYALRVKTSSLLNPQDPSGWTPWSEVHFRTPTTKSETISLSNVLATGNKKVLTWNNSDLNIFYNEVQVSGDTRFDPYPESATSFVWWNLVHAGLTEPKNSWTTPDLEPGTYYWRVRPRVQGDGLQLPWTSAGSFTVGVSSNE